MTTARSTPNLLLLPSQHPAAPLHSPPAAPSAPAPLPYSAPPHHHPPSTVPSIYTYLQSRPGLSFSPTGGEGVGGGASPPPAPPVRDASSLKLKTAMERCDRYPASAAELCEGRRMVGGACPPEEPPFPPDSPPPSSLSSSPIRSPPYPFPLPRVDRDGKPIGDSDYAVPSPPERDTGGGGSGWSNRGGTRLTQADLEEYARTYEESLVLRQHQMMALQQSQHAAAAAAHMMLLTSLGAHHGHAIGHHAMGTGAPHHPVGGGGASSASSSSYAHSEGYHSYVSSCDSSASASHTPFLDRLRRESEATAALAAANQQRSALSHSSECHKTSLDGRGVAAASAEDADDDETEDAGVADEDDHHESSDSVCDEGSGSRLAHGSGGGGSGGSSSGGETLKWHGSVGDVSVASSSVSGSSSSAAARQLIAHSARVKTPQRHHSESVLYLGGGPMASSASTTSGSSTSTSWQARVQRNNALNHKLRMFPVNTYTVQPQLQMATVHHQQQSQQQPVSPSSPPPADQTSPRTMLRLPHSFSVAERIHELEKQSRRRAGADGNNWNGNNANSNGGGYTYLDPEKRHRVSDPTLKAIQKKALLSYYERHHRGGGRTSSGNPSPDGGVMGVARLTCVPGMASSTNSDDGMIKHGEGNGIMCSTNGTWRSEQQQAQPQVPTPSQQHHQQISPTQRSLSPQHQYAPQSPRSSSCQQKEGHSQPYHRSQSMDGRPSPPSEPPPNDDDASVSLTLPQTRGLPQNCAPVPYSRRSSSASDYLSGSGTWREHFQRGREATATSSDAGSVRDMPRHEHSASCGSLPGGELGPLILGPPISLDHWVPERPPKKPHLRAAFSPPHQVQSPPQSFPHVTNEISDTPPSSPPIPPPRTTSSSNSSPASAPANLPSSSSSHRCPSPDEPPPPPPPPLPEDDEVLLSDEPLPPPPPHLQPPSPQSHDSWSIPHGNNRKSPTSCPPPPPTVEVPTDGCARSNGVTYPTSTPYTAPERHFFGDNFNPSPSTVMTKSCSPPPRPQQLQPWLPMSTGDGGSSAGHPNHSQSSVQQVSPNVPVMGVPAIRTLVKSPNQGFATSKSVVPGRERPPVMSRIRANASQHWRSTEAPSESSRTSPKSPPLSGTTSHDSSSIPGPQSPVKDLNSSDQEWVSLLGSQAHRRPNHWQVPLKPTGRKFPSEHLSPSKNSMENIPIKSPSRSLQAMNLKNSDNDDNRHSHSHENGVGDRLIGERGIESVEENNDANSVKTKSGKFQANLVGKAALRTQSKSSSYLSTYHTHHLHLMHRRGSEKGTPNFEGSYKRTLSPPSGELLHLSKQSETLQQRGLIDSNSENKNQHHQHVPGWEERVPDMAGGTVGTINNSKDICETLGMKGGRRSRLDHSWVKSDTSWRDETPVTERRLDEEDGTSDMDEGEEDGERIRRGRRRRGVNGRENGLAVSTGSQSRSLTASSSSSSSSTMSSFSVSSVSTSSLPGMSSLRSPMSLAPYETSADSWVVSQSSPATQGTETDQSVSSGKADAASQTESLDEGVEVERRDSSGEEKGTLEEMAAKKEKALPETGFGRSSLAKKSSSERLNGAVENGNHPPSTTPPSSPPPSPPKCSPPANSPPQLPVPPKPAAPPVPPPPTPQSLTEEAECERLSRDLVSLLPPTDRLQGILAPIPDQKRPTDYVSGLFRLDVAPRPRSSTSASVNRLLGSKSSKNNEKESHDSETEESSKVESRCKTNSETVKKERIETPLPATSPYFTTSEPKARFLARYGRDVGSGRTGLEQTDTQELQRKKEELMSRLSRKLEVLREEAIAVSEEAALNEDLGKGVAMQLGQLALPHELSRFKLHVDEVGKVTSLLLALSGRLARAENALALEDTATSSNGLKSGLSSGEERKALEGKRDKLKDQLEEAKQLKASIDRRSGSVSAMLARYLDPEAFADYGHFISMKAKLIVDAREVSDKIKLGEEQLSALRETLLSSSFPTSTTNTICQSSAVSSTSVETSSSPSSVPEKSGAGYSGSTIVSHNSAPLTAGSN